MNTKSKILSAALLAAICSLAVAAKGGKGGGSNEEDTVNIFSTGVVMIDATCVNDLNDATSFIGCNGNDGVPVHITLDDFFLTEVDWGQSCFGDHPDWPTFTGTVQLAEDLQGRDQAIYRFTAQNIDRDQDVQYVLRLNEEHPSWSNGFPPPLNETTTLVAPHWSLGAYKRDQKHGPCMSGDNAPLTGAEIVVVDLTRTD